MGPEGAALFPFETRRSVWNLRGEFCESIAGSESMPIPSGRLASHVVQIPLRSALSRVLYCTIAMHRWSSVGCRFGTASNISSSIPQVQGTHLYRTRDGEHPRPQWWEYVKNVLLRHPYAGELEYNLGCCSPNAMNVVVKILRTFRRAEVLELLFVLLVVREMSEQLEE